MKSRYRLRYRCQKSVSSDLASCQFVFVSKKDDRDDYRVKVAMVTNDIGMQGVSFYVHCVWCVSSSTIFSWCDNNISVLCSNLLCIKFCCSSESEARNSSTVAERERVKVLQQIWADYTTEWSCLIGSSSSVNNVLFSR